MWDIEGDDGWWRKEVWKASRTFLFSESTCLSVLPPIETQRRGRGALVHDPEIEINRRSVREGETEGAFDSSSFAVDGEGDEETSLVVEGAANRRRFRLSWGSFVVADPRKEKSGSASVASVDLGVALEMVVAAIDLDTEGDILQFLDRDAASICEPRLLVFDGLLVPLGTAKEDLWSRSCGRGGRGECGRIGDEVRPCDVFRLAVIHSAFAFACGCGWW